MPPTAKVSDKKKTEANKSTSILGKPVQPIVPPPPAAQPASDAEWEDIPGAEEEDLIPTVVNHIRVMRQVKGVKYRKGPKPPPNTDVTKTSGADRPRFLSRDHLLSLCLQLSIMFSNMLMSATSTLPLHLFPEDLPSNEDLFSQVQQIIIPPRKWTPRRRRICSRRCGHPRRGRRHFCCNLQEVHLHLTGKKRVESQEITAARFFIPVTIGTTTTNALMDSGASVNLINSHFLHDLEQQYGPLPRHPCEDLHVEDHQKNRINISEYVTLPIQVHQRTLHLQFLVDKTTQRPKSQNEFLLLGAPYVRGAKVESFWTTDNHLKLRLNGQPDTEITAVSEPAAEASSQAIFVVNAHTVKDKRKDNNTLQKLRQVSICSTANASSSDLKRKSGSEAERTTASPMPMTGPPPVFASSSSPFTATPSYMNVPTTKPTNDQLPPNGVPPEAYEIPSPIPTPPKQVPTTWQEVVDLEKIPSDHRPFMTKFFEEHQGILSLHAADCGKNTDPRFKFPITTTPEFTLPIQKPYGAPPAARKLINETVETWLSMGVIAPSTANGCYPMFLVPKKVPKGARDLILSYRPVIDFRLLNWFTPSWPNTIPKIQENMDNFKGKKIFSKIDLSNAYLNLEIQEEDRYKTTFITPDRKTYMFTRLPFGLKNAPTFFQFFLTTILQPLGSEATVYLDDIILSSNTEQQHQELLQRFAQIMKKNGLKISIKKCDFFKTQVEYLSFIINGEGARVSEEKVTSIRQFQRPTTVQQVQSFVGLVNWVHRWVPNFQEIAAPLTNLFKKDAVFAWTPECEESFNTLKENIASATLLHHPDYDKPMHIYCDASKNACGAALFQVTDDAPDDITAEDLKPDHLRPLHFHSRKFDEVQHRYSILEKELLALLDAINVFNDYVSYAPKLVIHTDARTILYLLSYTYHGNNSKLLRYSMRILSHDNIEIHHCPGKLNDLADALSRQYTPDAPSLSRSPKTVTKDEVSIHLKEGETQHINDMIDMVKETPAVANKISFPGVERIVASFPEPLFEEPTDSYVLRVNKLHGFYRKFTTTYLAKAQSEDTTCRTIIDDLLKEPDQQKGDFKFHNGILVRKKNTSEPWTTTNSAIVVPRNMISIVISYFHSFGHCGHKRLHKMMANYFWFKGSAKITKAFARGCKVCQLNNRHKFSLQPTTNLPLVSAPNETWSMDFMTIGKSGTTREILNIVDDYSSFLVSFPCSSQKTSQVSKALTLMFQILGPPKTIRSDHGKSLLESKAIQRLCNEWGVEKLSLGIPHLPTKNAKVERANQSVRHLLKTLSQTYSSTFHDILPLANHVYNATPHTFDDLSPYEIYTGRPIHIRLPTIPQEPMTLRDYMTGVRKRHLTMQKKIARIQDTIRRRTLARLNKGRKQLQYAPGDLVVLMDLHTPKPGERPKKDQPTYLKTPYIIRKRLNNLVVLESILDRRVRHASINHLKPLIPRGQEFSDLPAVFRNHFGHPFRPFELLQDIIPPDVKGDFTDEPQEPTRRQTRQQQDAEADPEEDHEKEETPPPSPVPHGVSDSESEEEQGDGDEGTPAPAPGPSRAAAPPPPTSNIRSRLRSSGRALTRYFLRPRKKK